MTGSGVPSRSLTRRRFLQSSSLAAMAAPLWLSNSTAGWTSRDIIAETTTGKLKGKSVDGVNVFLGIPYGAPTGGGNRFMPPQKPQPWTGVRDALEFGPIAPQRNPKSNPAMVAASIYGPGKPFSIFMIP